MAIKPALAEGKNYFNIKHEDQKAIFFYSFIFYTYVFESSNLSLSVSSSEAIFTLFLFLPLLIGGASTLKVSCSASRHEFGIFFIKKQVYVEICFVTFSIDLKKFKEETHPAFINNITILSFKLKRNAVLCNISSIYLPLFRISRHFLNNLLSIETFFF